MLTYKKNRFKPIFKQLINLHENVQNRQKLLKFKKKKWKFFITFYKKKLKKYQKFKPLDHSKYFVTKYGTRGTSYGKRFKNTLTSSKRLKLVYGGLLEKPFKRTIKNILINKNSKTKNTTDLKLALLELFESRLDVILYRAKFNPTIRGARQMILHGKVLVNNKQIKNKGYITKSGDIISLNQKCLKLFETNAIKSLKWPIPPKHLIINYKTMQVLFLGNIKHTTLANAFSLNLRLQKILANYLKH